MEREATELTGDVQVVLRARNIHKSFGGVHALCGVSLSLHRGEVHALVGENGAGKSTLIKILTGALQPDAGEMQLEGKTLPALSPALARDLGIAAIYQQPALFPHLSVAENIALAKGRSHPWRRVDWKGRRKHASHVLEAVGARISPNALAGELTMPEQQLVEIAKAIDGDSKVLILDEPTASLGERDTENLFRVLDERRKQGTAIVYISHRFEELFRLADRVTVLRDGANVETCLMGEVTSDKLIRLMIGRELTKIFPDRTRQSGAVVFSIRGLGSKRSNVREVSLELHRGEILGMAGLVGSGRTELAELLFGLNPTDSGEMELHNAVCQVPSPRAALRQRIAYLPEDRRNHGVVLPMSIAANVTMASLKKVSVRGFINFRAEQAATKDYIRALTVKAPNADAAVGNLSGGNQQKVALARWLMTEPEVLILDEPTQGIDIGAKAEIYKLMAELAQKGVAILMISSDMNEVLGMSDRIAVMSKGTLAGVLSREGATAESILQLTLGHQAAASAERST